MMAGRENTTVLPRVHYRTPEDSEIQNEQNEYLNGLLWSDYLHRLDKDTDRDVSKQIDKYGNCSRHFWRGVLDWGGNFNMYDSKGFKYPRVQLNGNYDFLKKFLDFLKEELGPTVDPEGKLMFMVSNGKLKLSGALANQIVVHLYRAANVARTSNQFKADLCMTWTPRR